LVGIGASVGFFCAPLYVGWRAAHEGWRAPILEIGAAGLVVAAVFGLLAEKDQLPRPRADAPQPTSTGATPLPWACLAAASLLLSLRDFAGSATSSLASLFLQKAHQFNPSATGLALSAIFLPGIISNPLFGHLSDRSRTRSLALVLVVSAAAMMLLPYAPKSWVVPLLLVYGFFFMSSFPMVEAAVVMSAPEQVRGRVFGVFLTVGGLIGSLGHWFSGVWVRNLGERADQAQSYVGVFGVLAMLVIGALGALPFVRAMRRQAAPPTALAENGLESNQPEVAP
jgi:MFS family permease